MDLEVQLSALVGGHAAGDGAQRGDQRREDHQRLLERLAVDHADPAEVGQVGRQHREGRPDTAERSFAASAAPGTVCNVDRSCGSALATSPVNRARPSASDLMSSPPRICASRNGPAWSISCVIWP